MALDGRTDTGLQRGYAKINANRKNYAPPRKIGNIGTALDGWGRKLCKQ